MFEIGKLVRLDLGYQGENKARVIAIDMQAWLDEFPGAAVGIMLRRPDEDVYYPAALEMDDGIIKFEVTRSDVAIAGEGEAQIILTSDEDVELRSRVVKTKISPSLSGTEVEAPPPQQTWVSEVLQAAQGVEEAVNKMPAIGENGNWLIWDPEAGEMADSGIAASGKPGDPGDPGESGKAATIKVGTVTTLAPGSMATVKNSGTESAAVLDFGIPQGMPGTGGGSSGGGTGGEDGGYYLPTVTEGILTWVPSKAGMPEAGSSDIRGPVGKDGADGGYYVPTVTEGILAWAPSKEGMPEAGSSDIRGPAGKDGEDGYTPIKGTDYWTEADIASIKAYVDDAILNGAW